MTQYTHWTRIVAGMGLDTIAGLAHNLSGLMRMMWDLDYFVDRREGLTVSSIICNRWWHLKLVALKCHRGWAAVKIKGDIVQLARRSLIVIWVNASLTLVGSLDAARQLEWTKPAMLRAMLNTVLYAVRPMTWGSQEYKRTRRVPGEATHCRLREKRYRTGGASSKTPSMPLTSYTKSTRPRNTHTHRQRLVT